MPPKKAAVKKRAPKPARAPAKSAEKPPNEFRCAQRRDNGTYEIQCSRDGGHYWQSGLAGLDKKLADAQMDRLRKSGKVKVRNGVTKI